MNLTFRNAERKDTLLILQFIKELADYEKMLNEHLIEVGENMKVVVKRFLDSALTMEEVSMKMDAFIENVTKLPNN